MKELLQSTLWLSLGYGIGQGSILLFQLYMHSNTLTESLGVAVILISLVSFCFQFSDFGNNTIGLKLLQSKNEIGYLGFLLGRALISIPVLLLTVYLSKDILAGYISTPLLLIVLPVMSFLYGFSNSARFELTNEYFKFSIVQMISWLILTSLLMMHYIFEILESDVFILLLTIIPIIHLILSRFSITFFLQNMSSIQVKEVIYPLSVVLPSLIGQLWGRQMLFIVGSIVDITILGPLGIIRSLHTGLSIGLRMLIRPYIAQNVRSLKHDSNIKIFRFIIIAPFSLLTFFFYILSIFDFGLSDDLAFWMPILIGVPLWGISTIIVSKNQIIMLPKIFSSIEVLSFVIHAATFLLLVRWNPPWAFVLSDLLRLLFLITSSHLYYKYKVNYYAS